jgi:hypothetical protein
MHAGQVEAIMDFFAATRARDRFPAWRASEKSPDSVF